MGRRHGNEVWHRLSSSLIGLCVIHHIVVCHRPSSCFHPLAHDPSDIIIIITIIIIIIAVRSVAVAAQVHLVSFQRGAPRPVKKRPAPWSDWASNAGDDVADPGEDDKASQTDGKDDIDTSGITPIQRHRWKRSVQVFPSPSRTITKLPNV